MNLERYQNKCLRAAQKADRLTSNFDLHQRCKVLPLRLRWKASICGLMYKRIDNDPNPITKRNRLGTRSEQYIILEVPLMKRVSLKRSVSIVGPTMWNKLPNYIKASHSYAIFKRKLERIPY